MESLLMRAEQFAKQPKEKYFKFLLLDNQNINY